MHERLSSQRLTGQHYRITETDPLGASIAPPSLVAITVCTSALATSVVEARLPTELHEEMRYKFNANECCAPEPPS